MYFLDDDTIAEQFPFTKELAANWEVLRDEYKSAVHGNATASHDTHIDVGSKWTICVLKHSGYKQKKNQKLCPETTRLISKIPGLISAAYSVLAPGGHLPAHNNYPRDIYRMHLGIIVPNGCTFRVADESKDWKDGEWMAFDPNHEHEAWNRSDQTRVILLIDVWRNLKKKPIKDRIFHSLDGLRFSLSQNRVTRPIVDGIGNNRVFRKVVRVLMRDKGEYGEPDLQKLPANGEAGDSAEADAVGASSDDKR